MSTIIPLICPYNTRKKENSYRNKCLSSVLFFLLAMLFYLLPGYSIKAENEYIAKGKKRELMLLRYIITHSKCG
jgi:hypothetical protein